MDYTWCNNPQKWFKHGGENGNTISNRFQNWSKNDPIWSTMLKPWSKHGQKWSGMANNGPNMGKHTAKTWLNPGQTSLTRFNNGRTTAAHSQTSSRPGPKWSYMVNMVEIAKHCPTMAELRESGSNLPVGARPEAWSAKSGSPESARNVPAAVFPQRIPRKR